MTYAPSGWQAATPQADGRHWRRKRMPDVNAAGDGLKGHRRKRM